MKLRSTALLLLLLLSWTAWLPAAETQLRVGTFDVDASPPVGSLLAYDPVKDIQSPLSCRGIVILGADDPIVLCAIDWLGVSNDGQRVFKEKLAQAAGTTPERVAVHAIHQHDAPRCDFSVETILAQAGVGGGQFDPNFARVVIQNAADAVREATKSATPVDSIGLGEGIIEKVASNRRVLGPDGKVQYTRYTATKDPVVRAKPVGTIDPAVKLITFFKGDEPVAVLTYYATHPQSYYRTGLANPDFPGMARNARQDETSVPHIHFNGAGGNIGAGKWNDGSKENRQILADRVEAGMKSAWETMKRQPISADDVSWATEPVLLPLADHLVEENLQKIVHDPESTPLDRHHAAKHLAWMWRCQAGDTIDIGCLTLKNARVLHMPGELFVEYQLAAQKMRTDLFVAMAAYGEYAPGYICTEIAYSQGGYESSDRASRVSPAVEKVLMDAMAQLLESSNVKE
ncbi:hypothetical protein [Rubinisphaera margarita]|uniref:hypothetical protein n=1 Tax=Rubinisphaera margarita TaxID=2909586 RepID=UPI001EE78FD0|nr:hypothetical protein [Rubinisphaera margarita]MCG6155588.1 hypothetical protein [Rubinisphaera margarita]